MKLDTHPPSITCPGCGGSGEILTQPLVDKLVSRTKVDGECWVYGKGDPTQYPTFLNGVLRVATHRLAHLIWKGPVSNQVLHHCDNSRCWRPSHLYDGDSLRNNRDRRERALTYGGAGIKSHFAKLNEAQVQEIRQAGDSRGMLPRKQAKVFAAQFGVHLNTIYRVFTGRTWQTDTRTKPAPREHWSKRSAKPGA